MTHRDEFMVILTENTKPRMDGRDLRGPVTTVSLTLNRYVQLGTVSSLIIGIWSTETAVLSYPHVMNECTEQPAGIPFILFLLGIPSPSFTRFSSWRLPSRVGSVTNSSAFEVNTRISLTGKETDMGVPIYGTILSNFVRKAERTPDTNSSKYNGWIIPIHTSPNSKCF